MLTVRSIIKLNSIVLLGLGLVLTLVLGQPDWLMRLLADRSPEVLYFVETDQPVVALTIDDGPDPATTPRILELLKQYEARATFFLIAGRIPGNEAVVSRMVAERHELANHTVIDYPSVDLEPAEFERQLLAADRLLSRFGPVRWFRPGSGWYDDTMLETVRHYRYRTALGSVYPFDPQIPSAWFATYHILWQVQPGDIIILHDYGSRGERTAWVLSRILPDLKQRGFRIVTLSELSALSNQTASITASPHRAD